MWDRVSRELAHATGVSARSRRAAVGTVIALRMAGSPRESEKPGLSGAAAIMREAVRPKKAFREYLRSMPFSGRKTYRAVVKKAVLAKITPRIAKRVAKRSKAKSLHTLQKRLLRYFEEETGRPRKLEFHSLQIACDLYSLGLLRVKDASDCPLSTGSRRGLVHVRRWEDATASIKSLAANLGRPAHTIQTSLCEFDKYVRWSNGAPMRRRSV